MLEMLVKNIWWRLYHLYERWEHLPSLYPQAVAIKKKYGYGILKQFVEIFRLSTGPGKLRGDEYYEYRLYDNSRFSWHEKQQFLGRKMENHFVRIFGMDRWSGLAHDKYLFNIVYDALGFPVPEILALYEKPGRATAHTMLCHEKDLENFLRSNTRYPFVSKPLFGIYSKGVTAVESFDPQEEQLRLTNGDLLSIDRYTNLITQSREKTLFGKEGFIFQAMLKPHPRISSICGDRLCTLRLVMLLDNDGPQLFRALWKVSSGSNMADNYWRQGNFLAQLDIKNGTVLNVVDGGGENRRHIQHHPDTGQELLGFDVPDWNSARNLCLSAASVMPGLRIQGWDIALTDHGPVLLEVNVVGGVGLPQNAYNKGMLDDVLRNFIARHTNK